MDATSRQNAHKGYLHPQIFEGKTALITGAASGIGFEILRHFTQYGAQVIAVLLDVRPGWLSLRWAAGTRETTSERRRRATDTANTDAFGTFCNRQMTIENTPIPRPFIVTA